MTVYSRSIRCSSFILVVSTIVFLAACVTTISQPSSQDTADSRSNSNIQSASQFVAIDQSEPAFIVLTGIPKSLNEKQLEEIKQTVAGSDTLTLLSWQDFLARIGEYARSVMLRNDYPDIRVVDGITCLLASQQGTGAPWGLTWNGGIALTFKDFQHARRSYETYRQNPAAYKAISDPRKDPVYPGGHLEFAGCD